jgi:hypothetical protein
MQMTEPRKPYIVGLRDPAGQTAALQLFIEEAAALDGANPRSRRDPRFATVELTASEAEAFGAKYGGALIFEPDAPLTY